MIVKKLSIGQSAAKLLKSKRFIDYRNGIIRETLIRITELSTLYSGNKRHLYNGNRNKDEDIVRLNLK